MVVGPRTFGLPIVSVGVLPDGENYINKELMKEKILLPTMCRPRAGSGLLSLDVIAQKLELSTNVDIKKTQLEKDRKDRREN